MSRMIVISDCGECPHIAHRGAFGRIAYIPVCRKTNREPDYTKGVSGDRIIATRVHGVPEWCPLAKAPPQDETSSTLLSDKNSTEE